MTQTTSELRKLLNDTNLSAEERDSINAELQRRQMNTPPKHRSGVTTKIARARHRRANSGLTFKAWLLTTQGRAVINETPSSHLKRLMTPSVRR